ncbi:hypothetical protein BOX15_Mlig003479g1 [Macrostomum lignano]|uniref:RING finger protein 141 n=1 Tax=Macrostomum lignano TaxID=282301 RepID=A0A267DSQ9_9PLAT|nr:hypothetical protein BOX15_Mlig003479g1 [Macrostomum lignano]
MHRLQNEFNTLFEMGSLTQERLAAQVAQLNNLCERELASQPTRLKFTVQQMPPHHLSLLWKALVRIECRKIEASTGRTLSMRLLSLRQLMSLRKDMRSLSQLSVVGASAACAGVRTGPESESQFTASVVLGLLPDDATEFAASASAAAASADADALKPSAKAADIEECCICMDRQADVLLQCAHAYCQSCIQHWIDVGPPRRETIGNLPIAGRQSDATCPICRSLVSADSWVIASAPDIANDEAAKLMLGAVDRAGNAVTNYRQQ